MVSAEISSTSQIKVKADAEYLTGRKSNQTNGDFSKVLTAQSNKMKDSEGQKYVSDSETNTSDNTAGINSMDNVNDVNSTDTDAKDTGKGDVFQKLVQESNVSQEDTQSAEEAISCILVQANELFSRIAEILSEQFNLSVEEVSECMNESGMNVTDMFDKNNISELVMKLTGEENTSNLLVNQSLSEAVMDIYSEAEEVQKSLMDELSVTQEEFTELLEKADVASDEKTDIRISDTEISIAEVIGSEPEDRTGINRDIQTESSVSVEVAALNNETEELQNDSQDMDSEDGMDRNSDEQNMDSYGTVMMGSVIDELQNAVDASVSVKESGISERIITRIIDEIRLNIQPDATSLELQLEPESLGKVSITVTSKAGILTAHIMAQNEVAKEAIESQMSTLREAFEVQGLRVEEVEVTLASRGFEQEFNQSQNSNKENHFKERRHISQEELDEINGIAPNKEELLAEEIRKDLGNTVSYSA